MVDKDRVAGSANQAAGKVKEWAGKVTGDTKLADAAQVEIRPVISGGAA